ncbi:MAG TPA: flavodoxin family protein [Dehalococcoidales bacterium]|nr:flavodoxin family protein [Dehalococcoidales bacterium]
MKVLIISGSRNREGKTARIAGAVARGVEKAGGQCEILFLTEQKLERCRQCNPDGWGICIKDHRCIIEDDFTALTDKIQAANLLVFANPVYFGDLSESLKSFLDRFRRIGFWRIIQQINRGGLPGMPPPPQGLPAVGICFAGGSGNGTTSALAILERTLQTCGFDCVDMITVRRQNLEMKLPLLEKVGEWLVTRPTSGPPMAPPR